MAYGSDVPQREVESRKGAAVILKAKAKKFAANHG
jgi:hypothetical protein